MSIKTKIATLAIAALAVTSVAVGSASAKPKINPVAAGLFGAAVVGTTIIAASQPSYGYYPRHRHCFWKPVRNMFGQVIGHVRECHRHFH